MHPIERLRYVARSTGLDPGTLAYEAADALAGLSFDAQALVIAARRLLDAHLDCGPLWWVAAQVLAAEDPTAAAREVSTELVNDPTLDELAGALPGGGHVIFSPSPLVSVCDQRPDLSIEIVEFDDCGYEAMRVLRMIANAQAVGLDQLSNDNDAIALVPLVAASADGYLLRASDAAFIKAAKDRGIAIWATAGVGCVLPKPIFAAMSRRLGCYVSQSSQGGDLGSEDARLWEMLAPISAIDVVVGPDGPFLPTPTSFRTSCPVPGELCVR